MSHRRLEASTRLARAIADLDIPEELADEAVVEFERVSLWLGGDGSPLQRYGPELYPQGSFRLGTPVRPVNAGDDFDIDLVCRLQLGKEQTTQDGLKSLVGDRLKASEELKRRLNESRRCWTLTYKPKFHLDVLPAIPDAERPGPGILLTDRDLVRWQFSNPIGYAAWFYERMATVLDEARTAFARTANVSVEDVPEWRVRTPLQRSVQLLKRHRDIRFANRPDNRPSSIIITTLAGRAYRQQRDLTTAVLELADEMPNFIEREDNRWWVRNPAHPNENFADKWNENPDRRDAFLAWLEALRTDVHALLSTGTDRDRELLLERRLGIPNDPQPRREWLPYAPGREDLSHVERPEWPADIKYTCEISAAVHSGLKQGKRLYWLRNLVFKRLGIQFTATTNTPPPYTVKWQVTNTGAEARAAGQLRGGFVDGEGPYGTTRWERTAYAGTHVVEAFVIKGSRIVARSGPFDVKIAK